MAGVFPLLITNQKIWLGLNTLPSIPRTRQRVNSGKFSTWMYLPYCVPIHWGRGVRDVGSRYPLHSRLFWKSCKFYFLSWFGLLCLAFVLFCSLTFGWFPAELGRFLWGPGQVPFSGMASFHLAQHLSLCPVSSKPKMILISTDMYSRQLQSDLY